MRYVIFLLLFGCVPHITTDELMEEAKQCIIEYNENGIVLPAPDEHKIACWEPYNERLEREAKRRAEVQLKGVCRAKGQVEVCGGVGGGCSCMRREDVDRLLRRW